MKPSEQCKKAGMTSLKQIEKITNGEVKERTFINWFESKPELVKIILAGIKKEIKGDNP